VFLTKTWKAKETQDSETESWIEVDTQESEITVMLFVSNVQL